MKEKERISNLEELMAEVLMRLDKLETGQEKLQTGVTNLQIGQTVLENGQITLQTAMLDLVKVARKNSIDIEYMKENMVTKEGLSKLSETMMSRFDKSDGRMELMQADIQELKRK